MKVIILDACDGFSFLVIKGDVQRRYRFDQEGTLENMVEFFDFIGVESEYEEDY